jgi:putative ABC transport system permease protein
MLSPRWRKVVRDLWGNRARTILVVLSIAVGVFAVGMVAGSRVVFSRELNQGWASINPPSATLYTSPFDDEMLATIRHMPEVAEADARRNVTVRFKLGTIEQNATQSAENETRWRTLQLYAFPDYNDIRILEIRPQSGAWPPPERELLIERASLEWMGVQPGDVLTIEAPNGKLRELRVAGVVHDQNQIAASWVGQGAGYIGSETLAWLGISRDFDELNIIVANNRDDKEHITKVAKLVRDKVEKSGRYVGYTWVPTPGKHPADEVIQPIMLLMGALGALSLVVSGFLVFNTLQALLTQQVRQIGIMKAVGARAKQIIGV